MHLHFEAVIIDANDLVQPKTVIQVKLQPVGCTQAVVGLYIFAVNRLVDRLPNVYQIVIEGAQDMISSF